MIQQIIPVLREYLNYFFLAWIALYFIAQRKFHADKKRYRALFFQAIWIFLFYAMVLVIHVEQLDPRLFYGALLILFTLALIFRKQLFPYTRRCRECENKVEWKDVFISDDDLCRECQEKAKPVDPEIDSDRSEPVQPTDHGILPEEPSGE